MNEVYTIELVNDDFVSIYRGLYTDRQKAVDDMKAYRGLGWGTQLQVIKYEGRNVFTVTGD